MSVPFNAQKGLIIVRTHLWGTMGETYTRLALDTGATSTVIRTAILVAIGYDPAVAPHRVRMMTASGVEYVPRLVVDKLEGLGQERVQFPVIAHTLPPSASVDGVLGLDFLRGQCLTIDFRTGQITVA